MKKFVSGILAAVLLCSVWLAVPVCAYDREIYPFGDVNEDGNVGSDDALFALQYSVAKIELTERQKLLADVSVPVSVNSNDALAILQYSVKKIDEFTPPYVPDDSFDVPNTPTENNAYVADESADTSFVLTSEGLAENTFYRLEKSLIQTFDNDTRRLLYAFQGLLNRDFGHDKFHTAMIYCNNDESDETWFNYIKKEGNFFHGYNEKTITSFGEFCSVFLPQLKQCGYILWDPKVPATANVALTICSLDGYLPVQSGSSLENILKRVGLAEKMSLVGMFADNAETLPQSSTASSKSAKADAYLWALEKYFPRCSDTYVAYTLDGAQHVADSPFSKMTNSYIDCVENHDYIVARRAFVFDLSPYSGEVPCDDQNQVRATDSRTMKKIFAARYERAEGKFGQLLGFPPWWLKYTADSGTGSNAATWIEWLFSETISCYNLAKEADAAGPAHMNNGSLYYKYRVPENFKFENNDPAPIEYQNGTKYFTIYLGDYDSSAWLKQHTYTFWIKNGGDNARGQIPLMWAFNPNLSYRVPMVFQYVYENKSANDYFTAGDSGAGYIMPSGLSRDVKLAYFRASRPPIYDEGFDEWASYSKMFYDRFDMSITGFIINGENPLNEDIYDCFNKFSTEGSFHNDRSKNLVTYKGVPYLYLHNGIDHRTDMNSLYSHSYNTMSGVSFSAFRTVCISPSNAKTIVDNFTAYCRGRGSNMQYVDSYNLLRMAKASGQGTIIN